MKRFVDHLSRELFRYSLIIIATLFMLYTFGMFLGLRYSTVGVLDSAASTLTRYLSVELNDMGGDVDELSKEPAVLAVLFPQGDTEQLRSESRAAGLQLLYDASRRWPEGSSFVIANSSGRVVATNLYRDNKAAFDKSSTVNNLRSKLEVTDEPFVFHRLGIQLDAPHRGSFVLGTKLEQPGEIWDGSLLVAVLGETGLVNKVRQEEVERIVITDDFENVVIDTAFHSDRVSGGALGKFEHSSPNALTLNADGVDYFFAERSGDNIRASIYVLSPQRTFWRFVTFSFISLSLVALLAIVLAWILTKRRSRHAASALVDLDEGLSHWASGKLDYRLADPRFSEFAGIYSSFNQLVDELEIQRSRSLDLEKSRNALEIRQLEERFNPHLVFNTLEMLRYEIVAHPETASRIVLELASIMRYSVRGQGQAVRFEEDLEYIRSYLTLNEIRMGDRLHYGIDASSDALEALVPRLLIQPLVENALRHGGVEKLNVCISAEVIDDDLVIGVRDNGTGVGDVGKLNAMIRSEQTDHLGLYLVNRIIHLVYPENEKYGLSFREVSVGTHAVVTLPYEI